MKQPRIDPNCPYASVAPTTIIDRFALTVERFGNRPAIALKRPQKGECVDNVDALPWKFWTWKEYHQECTKFAKTLLHLRCEPFTVVNCIGFNSPEWFMANNGALLAACITAGIYTTSTPEACQYISQHSKAQVVVVEGNAQLAKYSKIASTLPHLKCIVVWGNDEIDLTLAGRCGVVVYGWSAFLALGVEAGVSDAALETRQRIVRPGNCSTLIYTSGTTGPPKAVMCSHDNITWTTSTLTDNYLQLHCEDRVLSYLPLSHIAAQIMDVHVPMLVVSA